MDGFSDLTGTPGLYGGALTKAGATANLVLLDPLPAALYPSGKINVNNASALKGRNVVCQWNEEIPVPKVLEFVENEGATALVVIHSGDGVWPHFMQGDSDAQIPCVMVSASDGKELKERFSFFDILGVSSVGGRVYSTTDIIFAVNGPKERLRRVGVFRERKDNVDCCDCGVAGPHDSCAKCSHICLRRVCQATSQHWA
jgi:hypothetical protein